MNMKMVTMMSRGCIKIVGNMSQDLMEMTMMMTIVMTMVMNGDRDKDELRLDEDEEELGLE